MSYIGQQYLITDAAPNFRTPLDMGDHYAYSGRAPVLGQLDPETTSALPDLPTKYVKAWSHSVTGLTLADVMDRNHMKNPKDLDNWDVKSVIVIPPSDASGIKTGSPWDYAGSEIMLICENKHNVFNILRSSSSVLNTSVSERICKYDSSSDGLPSCHWRMRTDGTVPTRKDNREFEGAFGSVWLGGTDRSIRAPRDADIRVAVPVKGEDSNWGPLIWSKTRDMTGPKVFLARDVYDRLSRGESTTEGSSA